MKDTLTHLHLICEDWKRELSFYKDEMGILKNRLLEVASKNTGKEILISVEHFEINSGSLGFILTKCCMM